MIKKEKLKEDMKSAMKARDKLRVSTLRMLLSEIKNAEIKKGEALTENDCLDVVTKEIKKRREAIPMYRQGGRRELAEKEELEEKILLTYLPEQLNDAEIDKLVDEAIDEVGANNVNMLGNVMKIIMPRVKGRANAGDVNKKVKERLAALLP